MAETPPQLLNHNITFLDGFLSHQEKGKLKSKLGLVFRGAFLHFYTKTLQSPGDTSLAGGKNLAAAFLALINIKPGHKSCSGTAHPIPTNTSRDQQRAPLKLTRHLLAFLEVERVFQYNKQRGHTQVMESFHIQAEQVPLSCFISSIRSCQNPTGLRCPPRG